MSCVTSHLRSASEIADRLRISERQLEASLSRLLATMGARNTPEAIDAAIRRGLVVRKQEQVLSIPSLC